MASINDLSLAKGLTAKVEDACAGRNINAKAARIVRGGR